MSETPKVSNHVKLGEMWDCAVIFSVSIVLLFSD